MTDEDRKGAAAIAASEQLVEAAQELLEAYRTKYRRAIGGISEKAPFRREFGRLAAATNECQLHPHADRNGR